MSGSKPRSKKRSTVAASDARKDFAALLQRVARQGQPVVIERHGQGLAALVSLEDLQQLEALRTAAAAAAAAPPASPARRRAR